MRWLLGGVLALVIGCGNAESSDAGTGATGGASGVGGAGNNPTGAGGAPSLVPSIDVVGPIAAGVHGMAFSSDDMLYFSDSFANVGAVPTVYRVPPPYTATPEATSITGELPAGLLWLDDALFVCDTQAATVTRYDAALNAQQTWSNVDAWNVIDDASLGLLAVTFNGRVVQLSSAGDVTVLYAGTKAPFDIESDAQGVFLSEQGAQPGDPGNLTVRDASGEAVRTIEYPWANPEGMARGPDGRLWVAETERGELLAIDDAGPTVIENMNLPIVVARAPDGSLFVNGRVSAVSRHVQFRRQLAPSGAPSLESAVLNSFSASITVHALGCDRFDRS